MYGPGSASFTLVAWTMVKRVGRWSFWRRGTGEPCLQHHCRGMERHEPADLSDGSGGTIRHLCRECGARPTLTIEARYKEFRRGDRRG